MAANVGVSTKIADPEAKPLDSWDREDVYCFIEQKFTEEIALKFKDEDIDGESIIRLRQKGDEDAIFAKLGLTTFGKVVKFKTVVENVLPAHLKRCVTPSSVHSAGSSKPSMSDLATYGKDMEMLYKAKRSQIQKAAVKVWPGNQFPNFRIAENKNKLDELAESLKEECSIPEINFGIEGIRKHIQSVFHERRRARKREKIDYDLPDKRMSLKGKKHDGGKPPLPTMPVGDDDQDQNDNGKNGGNDGSEGGDTDILNLSSDNSSGSDNGSSQPVLKKAKTTKKNVTGKKQTKKVSLHRTLSKPDQEKSVSDNSSESDVDSSLPVMKTTKPSKNTVETKKKEALGQSSISKPDQEVSAINLSSKSAKVLLLSYSGESAAENISRDYLYQIIKELGGKVSLAKSLHGDALFKAVAVKLVNHGHVKIKTEANLSNLKRSDIIRK